MKYQIGKEIGRGSFGTVYEAQDASGNRYAAKLVTKDNALLADLLRKQFEFLASLDHKRVVKALDFDGDSPLGPMMVTELIRGTDLGSYLKAKGTAGLALLVAQVLDGLRYIHSLGRVHGDLKPESIMVCQDSNDAEVKLIDAGFDYGEGSNLPTLVGTLSYLAPEVIRDMPGDARSDLYSLGVTLYQALTGQLPFDGSSSEEILQKHLEHVPPSPSQLATGVDPGWDVFLGNLLRKEPFLRYPDADAAGLDLERILRLPGIYTGNLSLPGSTSLAGRSDEVERLRQLLISPGGEAVLLCGERGCGVSRLLRETATAAKLSGYRVLAVTLHREMPALVQIAEEVLGFESGSSSISQAEPAPAVGEETYLVELLEAFQSRLPAGTKHLLIIDRGEVMEEREHRLLGSIASRLHDRLSLLIGYQMDGYAPEACPDSLNYHKLEVKPLSLDDLRQAVSIHFGTTVVPGGLLDELYHSTKGNPGLLQRILEHLWRSGSVRMIPKEGRLELRWDRTFEIPKTIRDMARDRLAELSPLALRALKIVCASAGELEAIVLARMLPGVQLEALRRELSSTGLAESDDSGTRLRVRSDNVAEIVREGISPGEIRDTSLKIASLVEQMPRRMHDDYRLGVLYLQAGVPERAYRYLMASGDHFARFSARDALLAYRKALESGVDPDLCAAVEEKIGDLKLELGELEDAISHFYRSSKLRPSSLRKMGWAKALLGKLPESVEILEKCKEIAVEGGDEMEQARVLSDLGYVHTMRSERELGLRMLQEARCLFENSGMAYEAASASNRIGLVEMRASNFKKASGAWTEAKRSFEEAGYRKGVAVCLMNLGLCFRKQMNFDRADQAFQEALEILEKVKAISVKASCQQNYALLLADRGQLQPAWQLAEGASKISGLLDRQPGIISSSILLAALALDFGNWREAKTRLEALLEKPQDLDSFRNSMVHRYLALAEAMAGHLGEACGMADTSYRLAGEAGDAEGQGQAMLAKSTILLRFGRANEALASARRALAGLSLSSSLLLASEAQRLVGEALCLGGEVESGLDTLMAAREGFEKLPDSLHMGRVLLGLARGYQASGDHKSFNSHLRRCMDIFRKANARYDYAAAIMLGGEEAIRRGSLLQARHYLLEAARIFESLGIEDLRIKVVEQMKEIPSGDLETKAVTSLSRISQTLNSSHDLTTVLNLAMDLAIEYLGAERGVLMLQDEATGELTTFVERQMDRESLREVIGFSKSIVESVQTTRESVIASDATQDPRFRNSKSVRIHNIMSVMCVPLKVGGALQGIIYLDSRGVPSGFSKLERAFVEAFANQVALAIANARFVGRLYDDVADLRSRAAEKYDFASIIGPGKKMQEVFRQVDKAAKSTISVLLTGESGTGKELIAGLLHELSPRRDQPLVRVNCVAIQRDLLETELFGIEKRVATGISPRSGFFERANGGTIFLDEVGDMPLTTQMKVLRVLAEKEFERVGGSKVLKVDVRVISATNQDLKDMIEKDRFRRELYYRLNGMRIHLPPLKERMDDLPALVDHFLGKYSSENSKPKMQMAQEVLQALRRYPWPGNVRELEKCIEHAVVVAEHARIEIQHLPSEIRDGLSAAEAPGPVSAQAGLREAVRQFEKRSILKALQEAKWVKTAAAEILGMPESTLRKKMKALGIGRNGRPASASSNRT